MFDHVKFGVSDYAASKAFFLKALERLSSLVRMGITSKWFATNPRPNGHS